MPAKSKSKSRRGSKALSPPPQAPAQDQDQDDVVFPDPPATPPSGVVVQEEEAGAAGHNEPHDAPEASSPAEPADPWTFGDTFTTDALRVEFVERFRNFPILYDRAHPDYRDKPKKKAAKEALAQNWLLTIPRVDKAIKHLWSMLGSSKSRIEAKQSSGAGREDPFLGAERFRFWWEHLKWMMAYRAAPRKKVVRRAEAPAPELGSPSTTLPSTLASPSLSVLRLDAQMPDSQPVPPTTPAPRVVRLGSSGSQPSSTAPLGQCGCPRGCCDRVRDQLVRTQVQLDDSHRNFMTWLMTESSFLRGFPMRAFHAQAAAILTEYFPPGSVPGQVPVMPSGLSGGVFSSAPAGVGLGPALSQTPPGATTVTPPTLPTTAPPPASTSSAPPQPSTSHEQELLDLPYMPRRSPRQTKGKRRLSYGPPSGQGPSPTKQPATSRTADQELASSLEDLIELDD